MLVISFRALKARKVYSSINIVGLSLGVAITGLVYLLIKYENNFDRFHENRDRIFRLESNIYFSGKEGESYWRIPELPAPLIDKIRSEIPGINRSTRFIKSYRDAIVQFNDEVFSEKITYVDKDFFEMFSFNFLRGNRKRCFIDLPSVVMSESSAQKYFGSSDPIGKIISVEGKDKKLYTVRGVVEDLPDNSSINFSLIVPVESWVYYEDYRASWNEYTYAFFVELNSNINAAALKNSLNHLVNESMKTELDQLRANNHVTDKLKNVFEISISSLTDIHWNTKIPWEKTSNPKSFHILIWIAFIIIILACINLSLFL